MPWPATTTSLPRWGGWFLSFLIVVIISQEGWAAGVQAKRRGATVVPLSSEQLGDHIDGWTTDVAVLFCTPSIPTCKLFAGIWEDVARHHAKAKTKELVIAQFDCERDYTAEEVCYYLGIDRYPTIMFFGYGSYYHNDLLSSLFSNKKLRIDRAVTYEGELGDPQQVSDWTDLMHWASGWHRLSKRITSFFFSPWKDTSVMETTVRRLKEENYLLREELRWQKDSGAGGDGGGGGEDDFFSKASKGGKKAGGEDGKSVEEAFVEAVDELLGPVKGSGDPWVEVAKAKGKDAEALQMCIRDFAGDYCVDVKKKGEEPFCDILPKCVDTDFKAAECRPAKCPFVKDEGKARMENCLRENVIELYQEMVGGTPATGKAAAKDKK